MNIERSMAFEVVRTTTFKIALDKIFSYITEKYKNPKIVDDMLIKIEKSCDILKDFPEAYTKFIPNYVLPYQYRYFKVKKYKIFYRIDYEKGIIYFETIAHSFQDIENNEKFLN